MSREAVNKLASLMFSFALYKGQVDRYFAYAIHRTTQLIDQIGLTLIRIEQEKDKVKNIAQSGGFAQANQSLEFALLLLDIETLPKLVCTLMDNFATLAPYFYTDKRFKEFFEKNLIKGTPFVTMSRFLDKEPAFDQEFHDYLKKHLEWFEQLKQYERNPFEHSGIFVYSFPSDTHRDVPGVGRVLAVRQRNDKPQIPPQILNVKEELSDLTVQIRNMLINLFKFLDFYVHHFEKVIKQSWPSCLIMESAAHSKHGLYAIERWLTAEII